MTTLPTTIGGAISVVDSDELATLSLAGLPVGTKVWNVDVGAFFTLTTSDRTDIDIETTDSYTSPTWSFANATFTGFEGCTLVVVLQAPNVSLSRGYTIDVVSSATDVTVLDPPSGDSSGELFGSCVLYDDALVTDSVVSANGTIGLRWIKDTSNLQVQTVTGPAVNNTDARNPVIVAPSWQDSVAKTIQAIDPTLTRMALLSNCVNLSDFVLTAATGTGTIANTPVLGGGTLVSSGGTAGGLQIGQLGSTAAARIAANMRTNHYAIYMRAKFVSPPGATGQQVVMCCITDGTNDWNLGNNSATSQVNWTFGNQAGTPVDTTVPLDTNWHDLVIANDGTHLTAYIDGVQVGQLLSSGMATATAFTRVFSYNGGATATVSFAMTRWAVFTPEAP